MKTNTSLTGLLSVSALAIGLSVIAQPVVAGSVVNSKHDLSSTGNLVVGSKGGLTSGTAEICVFCHTPHGSSTAISAPLWNRANTTLATSYKTYTSATIDSLISTPGAVSLACLSCHDGTQARDNLINRPGPGGWALSGGAMANSTLGAMPGTVNGNLNLGTDLTNDHPIGMIYCGASSSANALLAPVGCADKDFKQIAGTTGTKIWVDTTGGTTGTFEKTDLPLYGGELFAPQAYVECATCHDPHNGNPVTGPSDNTSPSTLFLRPINGNASSGVCLACHSK